jgi:two-component system, OmpR family, alkaline phosphatase synthesis response regulator PhoP
MTERSRILVVEDNADLARVLVDNLVIEGHAVSECADGESARAMILSDVPDLVVLDVMLPRLDGFRVLREVREVGYAGLVLLLTARGEESDKVRGLRFGADDYLTKPFGLLEMLARVEALLRRGTPRVMRALPTLCTFGDVRCDVVTRQVFRNSTAIELSPKEFDLLVTLYQENGAVLSRQQLLARVWLHRGAIKTRTVDTHIAELRRKLEDDPSEPRFLLTVRKSGYRLNRG